MLPISKLIALAFVASCISKSSIKAEDTSSITGGTETTQPTVASWEAPTWAEERRPREYERWDSNKWDDGKELRYKKWDGKTEKRWDGKEQKWDGNQWEGKTNRWNEKDGEKEYEYPRKTWQSRPRKYETWGQQYEGVWDDGKEATRWDGNRWDGGWDGQRYEWNDAQKWGEQKWDGNRWEEKPRTWEKETRWTQRVWDDKKPEKVSMDRGGYN